MALAVSVSEQIHRQIVSIYGEKLRRSRDTCSALRAEQRSPATWANGPSVNRLACGQFKVGDRSTAVTAIAELLKFLDLTVCIVTIDIKGCQMKIAEGIVQQDGDYPLAVKEDQSQLYRDLKDILAGCDEVGFSRVPHDYASHINKGDGRIEIREYWALLDPERLTYVYHGEAWKNLRTVVRVRAERRIGREPSVEDRFYISSLDGDAKLALDTGVLKTGCIGC